MPKISSYRITSGDYEYELDIDFKDAAIMEYQVAFDVTARKRHVAKHDWVAETATLSFDFEKMTATVSVLGETIGTICLSEIDIEPGTSAEAAWEMISRAYDGSPIEEAIQMIPADPVFGCLIKAGISTTVGQTMRCFNEAGAGERLREQIRRTIVCLGENSLGMVLTATARTLRCVVTGRTWLE